MVILPFDRNATTQGAPSCGPRHSGKCNGSRLKMEPGANLMTRMSGCGEDFHLTMGSAQRIALHRPLSWDKADEGSWAQRSTIVSHRSALLQRSKRAVV